MRLVIEEDAAGVGEIVAKFVVKRITEFNPSAQHPFVLGLPTGSTPVLCYQKLVELYKAGNVSFQNHH